MAKKLEANEVCIRLTRAQNTLDRIFQGTSSGEVRSAIHLAREAMFAAWWLSLAETDPESPEDALRRVANALECIKSLRGSIDWAEGRMQGEEARLRRVIRDRAA